VEESEYFPGIQLRQEAEEGGLYFPLPQSEQDEEPLLAADFPASQPLQFVRVTVSALELNLPL
jgi:hypothetical protein